MNINNLMSYTLDVSDHIRDESIDKLAELSETLSKEGRGAYIPSYDECEKMAETRFAVILYHPGLDKLKKYAMHEKGITEININLLADSINTLPEELVKIAAANLTAAARKFKIEIPNALQKYASTNFVDNILDIRTIDESGFLTKLSESTKVLETVYALPAKKKYPITNPELIKKAEIYFNRYQKSFEPLDKLIYVTNIMKEAGKQGVTLTSDYISKYASLNILEFNKEFRDHIKVRKSFVKEAEVGIYNDLVAKAKEIGPSKTAAVLHKIDKSFGLTKLYGKSIEDPLLSVFSGPDKYAEMVAKIDGTTVSLRQLKSLNEDDLTPIIGNDAISELKGNEGLEVLASFPKPIRLDVMDLF